MILTAMAPRPANLPLPTRFGKTGETDKETIPLRSPQKSPGPLGRQAPTRTFMPPAQDVFHYNIKSAHGMKQDQTIVESLLGGGQIFGKIDQILKDAEQSNKKPWIMVNLYELQNAEVYPERKCLPGTPGADIHAGLVDRLINLHTNKKANVRIILDNSKQQPREMEKGQPKVLMEPNHNDRIMAKLKAFNVPFLPYSNQASIKNHVKLLMMDNRKAVVGGMNWGNHSAANHDGAVYIEGPDVRNIHHKVFEPDWVTSGGDVDDLARIQPFRQGKIKVLQTSGKKAEQGAKDEVLQEILTQIDQAKDSVHAQLFVLTHKEVVNALLQKHKELKRQGKEGVQLLVDEGLYKLFPNCRPGIQKLDDAGIPIRFFKENKATEEKLHAKWAVFDRKNLLIGSANWSSLGLDSKDSESELNSAGGDMTVEEGEEPKIPARTNHEIAVMIPNAPNVAGAFARQADHDFAYKKGITELSKPVSWNKQDQSKPWADQPPRPIWKKPMSPKRPQSDVAETEQAPSPKRRRWEA